MNRFLICVALTCIPSALAGSAQFSIPVRVVVKPVCELRSVTAKNVVLHCSRDYVPPMPHALPELFGQLPSAELRLSSTTLAPSGGFLNTYAIHATGTSGELIFY
jgi:hypothetical protein